MTLTVMNRFLLWALLKVTKGGDNHMIVVMAALIVYGDITFSQVPLKSKDAVKARLVVLGYDENGQPLVKA